MSAPAGPPPVLLCDADGCLFPSEDPAYEASATVTARFLAEMGIERTYTAEQLRLEFTGLNFRATAAELCRRHDVPLPDEVLERWVLAEREDVTRHLSEVLRPDDSVAGPLGDLARSLRLAVVSSSAEARVESCLAATGLDRLFAPEHVFSAEALRPPRSKPDPDVYVEAVRTLGIAAHETLAVEDSLVGVTAAVAAGIPVLGLLQFVAPGERTALRAALLDAGAQDVVDSWDEVAEHAAQLVRATSAGSQVL